MNVIGEFIRSILPARRQYATAADLPPELFPRILFFVSFETDEEQRYRYEHQRYEDGLLDVWLGAPVVVLGNCSLVCLYWANICRRYLFHGRSMRIRTREDAEKFRKYATRGSVRLVPLFKLIKRLSATQHYDSSSFLHLLLLPSLRTKLAQLHLKGPTTPGFPHGLPLDSPHWSVPRVTATPPSVTPFRGVEISNIHFPSLKTVVKLIKHFKDARVLDLRSLSWEDDCSTTPLHMVHSRGGTREGIHISASNCTDDVLICLQAAMLYPDSPLRMLPDKDMKLALGLFKAIYKYYAALPNDLYNKWPRFELSCSK